MINISQGKIRLESIVLDLSLAQVRPKAADQDLEGYYDQFIAHASEIGDYFEDKSSFDKAVDDAAGRKRPKLIARETKYPFLWGFKASFIPFYFLQPSKMRLDDKYFTCSRCITSIPRKTNSWEIEKSSREGEHSLAEKLIVDITDKFAQHPGYEGIIEITDDRTASQTKSSTFHEALHYLISRYCAETGRTFVKRFAKEDDLPQIEAYQLENFLHEGAIEILTDKLLTHDADAQFESRWLRHSLNDGFWHLVGGCSAIVCGLLVGCSISRPYLLPAALAPGRIRDHILEKYKQSKKDELLKPCEYPAFKI